LLASPISDIDLPLVFQLLGYRCIQVWPGIGPVLHRQFLGQESQILPMLGILVLISTGALTRGRFIKAQIKHGCPAQQQAIELHEVLQTTEM